MARTLEQIKTELTTTFMADAQLASHYGFAVGANFSETFSKVSIENLLLYIIAAAMWTHERLFDEHKAEVENTIAQLKPHTLRWYVNKVKLFREGQMLIDGTDQYDDTGLTDEDIADRQVVHFAAATETAATIYIKVATEQGNTKKPLTTAQLNGLQAYIAEIKDAGVRVNIINEAACRLRLSLVIYYDPTTLTYDGTNLINLHDGSTPVADTIRDYIENLPFNGEYSNAALIDSLQKVEGVVIPEVTSAEESYDNINFTAIDVKAIPFSGYYKYDVNDITIDPRPYE